MLYAQVAKTSGELIPYVLPGNRVISNTAIFPDTLHEFSRAFQQEKETGFCRNAAYFEFAGQGLLYSINYEYRFNKHLSLRAGFTTWRINTLDILIIQIKNFRYTSLPVMLDYLIGKRDNYFEIGMGVMLSYLAISDASIFYMGNTGYRKGTELFGTATLGYRYQRDDGGFIFRAGIMPIFINSGFVVNIGLSLGYGF